MASEEFHTDYIGFLQDRNADLLNRLAKMKEIYQNKIFSKDLNQHYLISTLMDVLNVCTALPEEIDLLFDKLSEAMSILINVLSRKSTLVQLGEKISKILNPTDGCDFINTQNTEETNNSTTSRKEPKIYLTRLSGNYTPNRRSVSEYERLSPILEVSPSNSPDLNNLTCKDSRANCENININPATYNYISQESPKGRFKGTKLWKKSISSAKQTPRKKKSSGNNENKEKEDIKETAQPQSSKNEPESEPDPTEDQPWINDKAPETQSSPKCFIDYRRRRHRYARIFDTVKEDSSNVKNENIYGSESYDGCDSTEDSKNLNREISCDDIVGETPTHTDEERTPTKKDILKRKEPVVLLEDCMTIKENSEKEKKSSQRGREKVSQKSGSKSKSESPTMSSSNYTEMKELDNSKGLANQDQRLKRKAAPTNLTEPKLGTKLRRN